MLPSAQSGSQVKAFSSLLLRAIPIDIMAQGFSPGRERGGEEGNVWEERAWPGKRCDVVGDSRVQV